MQTASIHRLHEYEPCVIWIILAHRYLTWTLLPRRVSRSRNVRPKSVFSPMHQAKFRSHCSILREVGCPKKPFAVNYGTSRQEHNNTQIHSELSISGSSSYPCILYYRRVRPASNPRSWPGRTSRNPGQLGSVQIPRESFRKRFTKAAGKRDSLVTTFVTV